MSKYVWDFASVSDFIFNQYISDCRAGHPHWISDQSHHTELTAFSLDTASPLSESWIINEQFAQHWNQLLRPKPWIQIDGRLAEELLSRSSSWLLSASAQCPELLINASPCRLITKLFFCSRFTCTARRNFHTILRGLKREEASLLSSWN